MNTEIMTETEERQALLNIRVEWSFGAFVREKMSASKLTRFWKRCDAYAGEMSARWVREWGGTEAARDAVAGASTAEVVRACGRLAELGRCIILEEAARHGGWDEESTPAIRSRVVIIG